MSDDKSSLLDQREEFLQQFFRKGAELTEELLQENQRLRTRVASLEGEAQGARAETHEYQERFRQVEHEHDRLANLFVASKQLVAALRDDRLGLWASMAEENRAQAALCDTDDYREGFAAFQQKRKPEFTGRG